MEDVSRQNDCVYLGVVFMSVVIGAELMDVYA